MALVSPVLVVPPRMPQRCPLFSQNHVLSVVQKMPPLPVAHLRRGGVADVIADGAGLASLRKPLSLNCENGYFALWKWDSVCVSARVCLFVGEKVKGQPNGKSQRENVNAKV